MYTKGRSVHTMKVSEKNFVINTITKLMVENKDDEIKQFMIDTGLILKHMVIKE